MNLDNAPEKGIIYALYVDRVVYKEYSKSTLTIEDNLLELHLFDENKEYRYIKKRNNEVETVIDDTIPHEDTYIEEITLDNKAKQESKKNTIKVINYITYDENDLLMITNYRLQEVK